MSEIELMMLLAAYMGTVCVVHNPDFEGIFIDLARKKLCERSPSGSWTLTSEGMGRVRNAVEAAKVPIPTGFRVRRPATEKWIENVPATEALVFKEDGWVVERMA